MTTQSGIDSLPSVTKEHTEQKKPRRKRTHDQDTALEKLSVVVRVGGGSRSETGSHHSVYREEAYSKRGPQEVCAGTLDRGALPLLENLARLVGQAQKMGD
jgi:hypothetical protein